VASLVGCSGSFPGAGTGGLDWQIVSAEFHVNRQSIQAKF
jgi:hypothetical protein